MIAARAAIALVLGLAAAACYRPSIADCQVTCSAETGCPSGFDCVEGVCRSAEGACPGGDPDGGLPAAPWAAASAGDDHTCAIDPDGALWCWGDGRSGQTGRAALDRVALPARVELPEVVQAVSAGLAHTCALTAGGALYCFGNDEAGALGGGEATSSAVATPVRVVDDLGTDSWSDWTAVSAGGGFTCGLRGPGGDQLYCWGANFDGQLGVGDLDSSARPRQVGGTWRAVSAGRFHACGIRTDADQDGAVWCWGFNGNAPNFTLGVNSTAAFEPSPRRVGGLEGFTAIEVGHQHTCALRDAAAGETWCWGINFEHQVTPIDSEVELEPVQINTEHKVTALALGDRFSCAATDARDLLCWGAGELGQTTSPGLTRDATPRIVALDGVVAIDAGRAHACARQASGFVSCWGDPGDGQLGDGVVADQFEPTQVGAEGNWTSISAGEAHTCGTRSDGTAACWGLAAGGRLGLGLEAPAVVADPTDLDRSMERVSAGRAHACGFASGTLLCWGADDGSGRLGLGFTVGDVTSPSVVDVSALTDLPPVATHAGVFTSCMVDSGGDVYCWGRGSDGQLGTGEIGPTANRDTPVRAERLSPDLTWVDAQTGDAFGCALSNADDADVGEIHCFGVDLGGVRGTGFVTDDPAFATAIDTPPDVSPQFEWIGLAVGPDHACGLAFDGELFCWGDNTTGAVADTGEASHDRPTSVGLFSISAVSAGYFHTCAISGGSLFCWGDGAHGKLGRDLEDSDSTPREITGVAAGSVWSQVAAGADHTCAIREDATLWCWGRGGHGQLGLGVAVRTTPAAVGRPAR